MNFSSSVQSAIFPFSFKLFTERFRDDENYDILVLFWGGLPLFLYWVEMCFPFLLGVWSLLVFVASCGSAEGVNVCMQNMLSYYNDKNVIKAA